MKLSIHAGATSQTINIFVQDSSSTVGAGLTGLVWNTGSLVAYYALPKAAAVQITLQTLAAITTAYASGGFKEVDSANMPGWYRLDLPDAALASGRFVSVHLKGATNMAPVALEIELTGWDNQDAVRGGLTALPNAVPGAAGLILSGTGAAQLDTDASGRINVGKWLGTLVTAATAGIPDTNAKNINNVAATSLTTINANLGTTQPVNFTGAGASALAKSDMVDVAGAAVSTSSAQLGVNAVNLGGTAQTGRDIGASVLLSTGTGTGQLDFTSGVVKSNLVQILATALTETLGGYLAAGFKKLLDIAVPIFTLGSTIQTGDSFARLGAPAGASHAADVAAVKVDTAAVKVQTDKLAFTVANQVDANVLDWKSATAPAMTGDAFARLGAPAGASIEADIAAAKVDTAAIKVKTDSLTFTVAGMADANVTDWKGATAPAMTGDAFARLGAPAGASVSADVAATKALLPTALVGGRMDASVGAIVAGQIVFKKNTAFTGFMFVLTDSSDHFTPKTGVTVTATRSIDGAAFASCTNAVSEVASGEYKIDLSTTDMNGANIMLKFTGSGADARYIQIFTQP